jgi:hypothetical protein
MREREEVSGKGERELERGDKKGLVLGGEGEQIREKVSGKMRVQYGKGNGKGER